MGAVRRVGGMDMDAVDVTVSRADGMSGGWETARG
jgi:hypothetical protein